MCDVGRVDPLSEVRLFPAASPRQLDVVITASFTLRPWLARAVVQTLRLKN